MSEPARNQERRTRRACVQNGWIAQEREVEGREAQPATGLERFRVVGGVRGARRNHRY